VQVVEVDELGVRAVVVTLRRRGSPMTFVLFPMIHLGSPQFYEAIRAQVAECDVVVAEGAGRTLITSLLTMTYRVARLRSRSGLVVQNLYAGSFGIPWICPDMTSAEVRTGWRKVPVAHRLLVWCLVPAAAVIMLVLGPRAVVARVAAMDDEPTLADLNSELARPEIHALLSGDRDRKLVDALATLHEQRSHEAIKVAVVYGAAHIPAAAHAMRAMYGYVARDGRYVSVFES
jgi:hypothetical protein